MIRTRFRLRSAFIAVVSLAWAGTFTACLIVPAPAQGAEAGAAAPSQKPNVLIITTDDMSCDSVGVFGCKMAGTTPNMDAFAATAMRFTRAHVVVGNCMPSRNVMWSGRYPHNNGIDSFNSLPKEAVKYPVLGDLFKAGGWFTGIRHKVSHSTPYTPFPWDIDLDTDAAGARADVKNAPSYGPSLVQGMAAAKAAGKPFCLMLNVADPHKPFYAEGKGGKVVPDKNVPSRVFTPEEVPVPGFLPDAPAIRQELALYYSSVRRADDAVGAILKALKESGEEERTLILFLSDHGMPLPFAKTQLYHQSTNTPLMVRWPGVTKPGAVDEAHLVSTVDLLPTLLEMAGLDLPPGLDGRSFAPLLKGQEQDGHDMVFKSFHENSGGQRTPMRAVQTKDFVYIFNPWSDGKRVMGGATVGTATCRQMRVLARTDEAVAARLDLFDHRVPAEAYDVQYDPDALTNLINDPSHAKEVASLEKALEDWMIKVKDPLLEVFQKRADPAVAAAYMKEIEGTAKSRKERIVANRQNLIKAGGRPNKKGGAAMKGKGAGDGKGDAAVPAPAKGKAAAKGKGKAKRPAAGVEGAAPGLAAMQPPAKVTRGQTAILKVTHTLPADLGEKPVLVTLKAADGSRLDRQELKAQGSGVLEVSFAIPADLPGDKVTFAVIVGADYQNALQHLVSAPVPVE